MSLRLEPILAVLEETARVARAAFQKGNVYLKMRDEIGTFYQDEDFKGLFSTRGQSAFSSWRSALITDYTVRRRSFRPAKGGSGSRSNLLERRLEFGTRSAGFDFSVLSEFCARLLEKKQESLGSLLLNRISTKIQAENYNLNWYRLREVYTAKSSETKRC